APNPTKVKTETRPHVAHEVPLLTATASRVIDMGGTTVASGSSGTPAAIEKSPPNFADEDPPPVITERGNEATAKAILESGPEKEAAAMGGASTLRGKSMAAIEIEAFAEDPDSEKSTSFTSMVGSPGSIYQPKWGVAAEAKNAKLMRELESLRVQFLDLQVSNDQLSQQVSTLQVQISGEERIKAAFEEFKKYEDDRVTSQCAEIDARLDALSIDFDEELYPHMLTAIAGRR
nr:hypothetical protein [Tanacetum cinerariifolium]